MKPTHSGAAPCSTAAAPHAAIVSEPSPALIPIGLGLTTITDGMIRQLLANAENEGDIGLAMLCSLALRPLAAIETSSEARQCAAALRACAAEINHRADRWRLHGHARDAIYARWVGALRDEP